MEVRGYPIAQKIYKDLTLEIDRLQKKHITPTLAVILVGSNPTSVAYIKQKIKHAEKIGAQVVLHEFEETINQQELEKVILALNDNPLIHGIIIQQPLPNHINADYVTNLVNPKKDVDGFVPNSPYIPPVGMAVLDILENIHAQIDINNIFEVWLSAQKVTVIGKGKSGGGPIIQTFKKMMIEPKIIDSKTLNKEKFLQAANIIISAVGKKDILQADDIKKGAIIIGVGQHKEDDDKFHGDFNEEEATKIVSIYTPTPGGVGVVNVACLLKNLVKSAENE